ncbi:hypothetical protein ACTI_37680 [Actinoplanes sp. OR16]|uniref:hypothetical protein n=1 Tax=Actinoplanes sp. OR16 TaxID=946334 RepID=UPI000F6B8A91|nr:hypothetical protein [Actinoplanes sp. OR16]BBH67083.1 hypothetical protein ACTI_37680 [Actinoplanes sp. OR16]
MIPRIHRRGTDLPGLLRYLYGPGREEAHLNPRLVAGAPGLGALDRLERDHTRLVTVLESPLDALLEAPPSAPVWHCSLRLAPADPVLDDGAWERICRDFMNDTGLAPEDDLAAMPWVAVRHGHDHVHIAGILARHDGFSEPARNDYLRARDAAMALESRLGLVRTAPADRTAARGLTAAELRKASRAGHPEPPRTRLLRLVRAAAAHTGGEDAFFAWMRRQGVLVRLREDHSGYAVALPPGATADHRPIWFGGGRLAVDLTLPRLRERWSGAACWTVTAARGGPVCVPSAADALTRLAWDAEGADGGPMTAAARLLDHAARDVASAGGDCPGHPGPLTPHALIEAADALAGVRAVGERPHQASAARQAADGLRAMDLRFCGRRW